MDPGRRTADVTHAATDPRGPCVSVRNLHVVTWPFWGRPDKWSLGDRLVSLVPEKSSPTAFSRACRDSHIVQVYLVLGGQRDIVYLQLLFIGGLGSEAAVYVGFNGLDVAGPACKASRRALCSDCWLHPAALGMDKLLGPLEVCHWLRLTCFEQSSSCSTGLSFGPHRLAQSDNEESWFLHGMFGCPA